MDARTATLQYVCPSLGALLAFLTFLSPLRVVLQVQKDKKLGELNPLPFIAMASNGLGWVVYGIILHDYFVYGGNVPGLLLGLFYVMTCYKYSTEKEQDLLRNITLGVGCLFMVMVLIHMAAGLNPSGIKTLWGATAVGILAVFYVSPLSTLAKVVRNWDSSSIHRPLVLMNMISGIMWCAYGIALRDWFLISPSGIGALLSFFSLILSFVVPRKAKTGSSANSSSSSSSANSSSSNNANSSSSSGRSYIRCTCWLKAGSSSSSTTSDRINTLAEYNLEIVTDKLTGITHSRPKP